CPLKRFKRLGSEQAALTGQKGYHGVAIVSKLPFDSRDARSFCGKLDARRTLAQSRIDALAVQRETRRLDLLAETAQRYLAVVGADRQRSLTNMDVGQRQRTVAA
ncbi:hypothetical protein J8J07_20880, partial [Mycobacterium tuberculosis]|nr:hypothetical protein [Mycobacterium tuberculosis]